MPQWSPRANEIFLSAIDIASAEERARYVERACEGDADLRSAVDQLLRAAEHASKSSFLESQAGTIAPPIDPSESATEVAGTLIGNYKLLERVGEGGFGVVYMAEQLRPVQRRVAIKILKPGMDSARIIARFEAERQALAMMDHPNIAKVLDAGTTDAGRPYFVMELVKGMAITRYCDQEQLTPQQRLELFIPVCQAVQHAHQKGVIHRDLKPSNVLIALYDGRPVPKVIDFGVAKAIGQKLTEQTVFTELGGIVGTLEYMSPEQAELNNLDIDTRADIYSLGVILYELLAGSPPFTAEQLRSAAFDQMLKMIRETEPAKPSTRLSSAAELPAIAARRKLEPARLTRLIHGELDWIVMKALEKDRARRYETANGLAMDVSRYLADEPVVAAAPSAAYRVRKFVRRHRSGVAAGVVLAVSLMAGIAGTTVGLVRERRQRAETDRQRVVADGQRVEAERQKLQAQEHSAIAQAVNAFLADMLSSADPDRLLGDKVTVLEAASAAVRELDAGGLRDRPAVEAAVRQTIGQTFRALGRYDRAEPNLQRAVELRRVSNAVPDRPRAEALTALGNLLFEQGKLTDAETLFEEALSIERATSASGGGMEDLGVVRATANLGWVLSNQGNRDRAIPMLRDALAAHRRAKPPDDRTLAKSLTHLGLALWERQELAEAEPLLREAVEVNRRALPAGHPDFGMSLSNLALVLQNQERHAEAEPLLREALSISRAALPVGHPDLATPMNNLAHTLMKQSKLPEAEAMYRESLAIRRTVASMSGTDASASEAVAISLSNLADVLRMQGKMSEAQPLMHESLDAFRKSLPAGHNTIGTALVNLGWSYLDQRRPAEAEPLLREALAIKRHTLPVGHPETLSALGGLAFACQRQSKFADAESLFIEAESVVRGTTRHAKSVQLLAALYDAWDSAKPGEGYAQKASDWRKKIPATQPTTKKSS